MHFDIRYPIGALFTLLGIVLTVWGLMADASVYEQRSLGININLIYGIVLTLVGVALLALAYAKRNRHDQTGY
jgi:drug/metabolite transporter (DMT)-like permease